jgi:hypothetical protein
MPDELVSIISDCKDLGINWENVIIFQKLLWALKALTKQRQCFYSRSYILVRSGKGLEPIDKYLNFRLLGVWMNKYERFHKNRAISFLCLLGGGITMFFKAKSILIISEIIIMGLSYFSKSSLYLKSRRFIYLNFTTLCDAYKIDYEILGNCHNEVTCTDKNLNIIRHFGRSPEFYIDSEKQWMIES